VGRFAESAEMYRRVVGIDPLNVSAYRGLGNTLWYAGKLDEAENSYRKASELARQTISAHAFLGLILLQRGRIEEARTEAASETDVAWRGWARAIIEFAAGRTADAEKILDEYIPEIRETAAFQIAEIYASMGRAEEAFEYLELSLATRDPGTSGIVASPLLRPLHTDARWHPLLRKIGIPEEYWPKS
jgi:tetratricopeptide (TPR) repeat protein